MDKIAMMQELLTCGTHIPLWHYDAGGRLMSTNSEHLVLDKIFDYIGATRYMLEHSAQSRKPLILGSDMGLLWCAVFETEKEILQSIYVMGPVYNAEIPTAFLEESISRYHIDPSFHKQYRNILKSIRVVPSVMFLQYGLMLHYCVTGQKLNRGDIQFQPRSRLISPLAQAGDAQDTALTQRYLAEQAMLRMIREGDRNYPQAAASAHQLFAGISADHRHFLPQATIRATGFGALCIREAVAAGISPDTAYAVGSGYMESMCQCQSVSELVSMSLAMFEDFTFRVHEHRTNPKVSPQIQSCRDYIELHAEQELKLPQLAKQVGYSEYYLSRKFKQEMGVSISTYIKYVRVERAKLMLVSTALPIFQIAGHLHFASSSHFSDAFREVTGKTPQQFRAENQKF